MPCLLKDLLRIELELFSAPGLWKFPSYMCNIQPNALGTFLNISEALSVYLFLFFCTLPYKFSSSHSFWTPVFLLSRSFCFGRIIPLNYCLKTPGTNLGHSDSLTYLLNFPHRSQFWAACCLKTVSCNFPGFSSLLQEGNCHSS